jgi:hypothetical protein
VSTKFLVNSEYAQAPQSNDAMRVKQRHKFAAVLGPHSHKWCGSYSKTSVLQSRYIML